MRDVIQRGSAYYVVSTQFTPDCGPETMVFAANDQGFVTSFEDLYVEHYPDMEKATAGHRRVVNEFNIN